MSTITIVRILGISYGAVGLLFGLTSIWASRRWPKSFRDEHTLKYHPEKITYPGDPLTNEEIAWIFACIFIWLVVVAFLAVVLVVYGLWSVFTFVVRPPLNWLFRKVK